IARARGRAAEAQDALPEMNSDSGRSVAMRPPVFLIMPRRWFDLASEDAVADNGVDQHQREDEETLAPEHEGESGMGRRRFFDRDRERDHVRPEGDRQCAERGRENERDHVVRHSIPSTPYTGGRYERRHDADHREDE